MSAVLPLLGGLLLVRFVAQFRVAVAVQAGLFAISAAALVLSSPSHGGTHGEGALLALLVAPVSVATFALGTVLRHRRTGVAE